MKKNTLIKRILSAVLSVCCMFSVLSINTHAEDFEVPEMFGVSFENPDDTNAGSASIEGTSRPSTVWNVADNGRYDFAGWSYGQTLYTNYKFKGKTSYTIHIENTSPTSILAFKAKTLLVTYAQTSLAAGDSTTFTLSGMDSSTAFYLTFDGSGTFYFTGYIE